MLDLAAGTVAALGYSQQTAETITLMAVAVIGVPESLTDSKKSLPPSVIVGGSMSKDSSTGTTKNSFILVYGLSPNVIAVNDSSSTPSEAPLKTSGRTGTKQESQHFDEDIFSYISEADMLSDSISIFSDMNMSDTSGTFVVDAATGSIIGGSNNQQSNIASKKKIAAAAASGLSSQTPSNKGVADGNPNKNKTEAKEKEVMLVQKIELPNDLKHCSVTKDILPTLDGEQVVLSTESTSTSESNEQQIFGALLVHKVVCESEMLKLDKQPMACRKFISQEEMPVKLCVIPPECDESALACILKNGMLCILRVNDLSLMRKIKRPDSDPSLTSISYVSSKLLK